MALFLIVLFLFSSGCGKNRTTEDLYGSEAADSEGKIAESEKDTLADQFATYEQVSYKASDSLSLPGFAHKLSEVYEVDGRQGVAWADGKVYVSNSKSLVVYDKNRNKIASNERPFKEISEKVDHIGDIDVYNGEIYAGVEAFSKGNSKNLLLAVYDAKTLELKEYRVIEESSAQIEISGITVDYDHNILWICSWEAGDSGRYLYRYDLFTKEYQGKVQLQASPQEIQGIAYYDGWIYISSDDGFADYNQPDHIYRCQADSEKTAFRVYEEQVLDDVIHYGELEGITFDKRNKQLLVLYNRGRRINQGIGSGYYDGYIREIHELYRYDWERLIRPMDYSEESCWAELPWMDHQKKETKDADVFLILPEVNLSSGYPDNMDVNCLSDAGRFREELAFERGIVSDWADIYAPLYRQASVGCCTDGDGFAVSDFKDAYDGQTCDEIAYTDVRNAWIYYMNHYNNDRPVVLFGSSQGAEMVLRLLKEFGGDDRLEKHLVAAYVIGAGVHEEDLEQFHHLKMAEGEKDTGVIVSFRAQAPGAGRPEKKELSVNPLNWKTDATVAEAKENKGCLNEINDSVSVVKEGVSLGVCGDRTEKTGKESAVLQPAFCGAYIDENTGRLIVTELAGTNTMYRLYYENGGIYPAGDYRLYGVRFFYENLRENVGVRVGEFVRKGNK